MRSSPVPFPLLILATLLLPAACNPDPYFESVLALEDTTDTAGPYRLEAYVTAPREVAALDVIYADDPEIAAVEEPSEEALSLEDGDLEEGRWIFDWPGAPAGTELSYYLRLTDGGDVEVTYPEGAPAEALLFSVLEAGDEGDAD